jgi:hypothetical protein
MVNRSYTLMICKDLDLASPSVIRDVFRRNRYNMRNSSIAHEEIESSDDVTDVPERSENPHPFVLRWKPLFCFVTFLVTVLVILSVIIFTGANKALVAVPWLLTALVVLIKLVWSMIDEQLRLMEPFDLLSRRHASPRVLLLDCTCTELSRCP